MPLKPAAISISDSVRSILSKFSKAGLCQPARWNVQKFFALCRRTGQSADIQRSEYWAGLCQQMAYPVSEKPPLFAGGGGKTPAQLEKEITILLADYARPGQPPTYTDEQIIKILEIACRSPEEYGYETSHWSLNQLVAVTIRKE